jgi:hypothetical protein
LSAEYEAARRDWYRLIGAVFDRVVAEAGFPQMRTTGQRGAADIRLRSLT